ncbi:cytochrome b5-like heme/steroid binding domain-containing protein [Cryomyces antarcticus]|nr:hypothetical protein LTR04_006487 [Oleoguttula sp. CCFEE 6159]
MSWFVTNESVLWGYRPWFTKPAVVKRWIQGPVSLTDLALRDYNGVDPSKPIYVALNGSIYDVTAGRHVYGPGGSYHFFAGRDAARAFVTGCFDEDLNPDLRGAEETYMPVDDPAEVISGAERKMRRERERRAALKQVEQTIEGWAGMFRGEGGKPYFKVGVVDRPASWSALLEKLPVKKLCDRAQKGRPKRKAEN